MKKIAYILPYFRPTDDFKPILNNKRGVVYDEDIVKYIEEHANYGDMIAVKGKESCDYMIGSAGVAYVLEIDETRTWILRIDKEDNPYVQYVEVKIDDMGQLLIW